MKNGPAEASPAKALLEELETFRALCHGTLHSISAKVDGQLDAIKSRVEALGSGKNVPTGKNRDIRDMLTLLRNADVNPDKGRRKDLKKLDSITEDLGMLVENW